MNYELRIWGDGNVFPALSVNSFIVIRKLNKMIVLLAVV
jgi:hypothetical protein